MPLNSTQLVFIARVLANRPTLSFRGLLAAIDSAVYNLSAALIAEVDQYNFDVEKVGQEAGEKGLTDPANDVAFIDGEVTIFGREYGRGLWIEGSPVLTQPDYQSTLEWAIRDSVRRAFLNAVPPN